MSKLYIEREAAKELMEQALVDEWEIQYADDRLDELPAADVVEVRHGRWVHGREVSREYVGDCLVGIFYDRWTCSECGYVAGYESSGIIHKFCPNCGAKMDGGENDG